jgi:hypothetical protein
VGFVEYLSNPHLPDCLHLNNLTGKPAAIVVNPSGRRPDSVEAAEWLWIQNNYFYLKKNSSKILLFTFLSNGKNCIIYFFAGPKPADPIMQQLQETG